MTSTTINPIKRHRERCREVRAQMSDYLDDDLDVPSAKAIERHTRFCPNCRRMLENLRRTVSGLRSLRVQPIPVDKAGAQD